MRMRNNRSAVLVMLGVGVAAACTAALARDARADEATFRGSAAFAPPPPSDDAQVIVPVTPGSRDDVDDEAPQEYGPKRSSIRLHVGPQMVTTGKGAGFGIGAAADLGKGPIGVRLSAAWLRGEGKTDAGVPVSRLGEELGQYGAEVTVDFVRRGALHPVVGVGLGLAHVGGGPDGSGFLGVGTGRAAVEYAVRLDDADVRLGAGLTGVLAGPADREVRDLRGWAMLGVSLGVGF